MCEPLKEEELAQLMILPLTVKGTEEKRAYIEKAVELAKQLPDRNQSVRVLAGLLTFTDKVIDQEYAKRVKEELQMTQVEQLIFAEGLEAGVEQGLEQGLEQGREFGIKALILDNLEEGVPENRIFSKLIKQFDLTEKQAREYLEKYSF